MTALAHDSFALARRNLEHVRQIPEKLLDVTLQPIMFVLLFAYVFGGVIAVPGGDYHEYLIGGILVQTLAFGMMGPGVSIATDMQEGIVDRFRSLPTSRSAFVVGHVIAEMAAIVLAITILTLTGLVVGWGIHSDLPHAMGGFGLLLLLAFAMIWVGMAIGLTVRSPDAVQGVAFMVVFPITFVSSVFVPASGLPDGLRQFAEWNPISALATGVRELFGNPVAPTAHPPLPLQHPVAASVIWCLVLVAIAAPWAINRYLKRTVD
jgi:ABC-2 type transport system permease protein